MKCFLKEEVIVEGEQSFGRLLIFKEIKIFWVGRGEQGGGGGVLF